MERLEDWLTTTQAAAIVGVSESMLRRLAKNRADIERQQKGNMVLWNKADIEKLAAERNKREG
jgi:hypothetical protein